MSRFALSPLARADIDAIWDYTADRWSEEQADRYIHHLREAMETIARDPRRGRGCDQLRPGYRRYSVGAHVLFFRVATNGIEIIRVLHQSMDFDRHL